MNYKIKIENKTYEIEIEDINARPVIAWVDGTRCEVSPENGRPIEIKDASENQNTVEKKSAVEIMLAGVSAPNSAIAGNALTAPLPGTVTEVFVKVGESVEAGQVILVIEAMKMKNSIRSTRSGKISAVLVSAGQSVGHKQILIKFES